MGGSVGGRDLDFSVATWKSHCGQERSRDMKSMSRHRLVSRRSRPGWSLLGWKGGRDMELTSRAGLLGIEVATPFWRSRPD